MNPTERASALALLQSYLDDSSEIVRMYAMKALADVAEQDRQLRPQVIDLLLHLVETGTPAMKSRGRKLLTHLRRL